jgi:hypothetical protein
LFIGQFIWWATRVNPLASSSHPSHPEWSEMNSQRRSDNSKGLWLVMDLDGMLK